MPNTQVRVFRLCKTPDGWRRYPVVLAKNGKIKHNMVRVSGEEKEYPVGRYQLRFYEGSRTVWKDVGNDPSEAIQARTRQANLLIAKTAAKAAGATLEEGQRRVSLQRALREFLEATEDRGSAEAKEVYGRDVRKFLEVTGRVYQDELVPADILKYQRWMRDEEYADRTIFNRVSNVRAFLLYLKIDVKAWAPPKPKYEETLPEIYRAEEMAKFFAAVKDERLSLTCDILLQCGLREQEAMYLEWPEVDLKYRVIRVKANPKFGFKVKDAEERDVPIPKALADRLEEFRKRHAKETLVTGTKEGTPQTHMLRSLKRAVNKAKLQCGKCEGCLRKKNPECERWFLHKFRSTYITTLLRSGYDLRTVMGFSGHSNLDTVLRYLRPAEGNEVRDRLDSIQWKG